MDPEFELVEIDPIKTKNRKLYARRGLGRRQDHANRWNRLRRRAWDDPEDRKLNARRRDRRHGSDDVED